MRKRYGWWLLGTSLLTMAIGAILARNQKPPPEALRRFEMVRVGMNFVDVENLLDWRIEDEADLIHALTDSRNQSAGLWCARPRSGFYWLCDQWYLRVVYDDRHVLTGKSLIYWNVDAPWHQRAWRFCQQHIPSLPDLPF